MSKSPRYLVETCLLTFGLASIDDAALAAAWDTPEATLCWLEAGEVVTGDISAYLRFRASHPRRKLSREQLDNAVREKATAALTASATMEVCHRWGISYAVSCGIGGLERGDLHQSQRRSDDLSALRDLPVTLIATSPKDMLDIEATVSWLRQAGVQVLGEDTPFCTGYLFNGPPTALSGSWQGQPLIPPTLLLRPIAPQRRLQDENLLTQAVAAAREAEKQGGYFHPAANAALDRLSQGYSSQVQLAALLDNIRFTTNLTAVSP